jgi:hypothetical protein
LTHSIGNSVKVAAALAGATLMLCIILLLGSPPQAEAGSSNFCYGHSMGNWETCYGSPRTFNAVYGQGTNHSVCVGGDSIYGCSPGGGQGVYVPMGSLAYRTPWIRNNGATWSVVYGVAYWP